MSPILKFCLINVSYVHCIYIDNLTQANIPESGLDPVSKRSWVLFLDVQKCITKMYVHCISVVLSFTLYICHILSFKKCYMTTGQSKKCLLLYFTIKLYL
jgi:hypothetical protein